MPFTTTRSNAAASAGSASAANSSTSAAARSARVSGSLTGPSCSTLSTRGCGRTTNCRERPSGPPASVRRSTTALGDRRSRSSANGAATGPPDAGAPEAVGFTSTRPHSRNPAPPSGCTSAVTVTASAIPGANVMRPSARHLPAFASIARSSASSRARGWVPAGTARCSTVKPGNVSPRRVPPGLRHCRGSPRASARPPSARPRRGESLRPSPQSPL